MIDIVINAETAVVVHDEHCLEHFGRLVLEHSTGKLELVNDRQGKARELAPLSGDTLLAARRLTRAIGVRMDGMSLAREYPMILDIK